MEAEVIQAARLFLGKSDAVKIVTADMSRADAENEGMVCGGQIGGTVGGGEIMAKEMEKEWTHFDLKGNARDGGCVREGKHQASGGSVW